MPVGSELDDLQSLQTWSALSPTKRLSVAQVIAERLGNDYKPLNTLAGRLGLPQVRHPSGLTLAAVPGGQFEMGINDNERSQLLSLADGEVAREKIERQSEHARPVRSVRVFPFLCATTPVLCTQVKPWVHYFDRGIYRPEFHDDKSAVPCHLSRAEVKRALQHSGFRTLSEAEWEYVAREGKSTSWLDTTVGTADCETWPLVKALAQNPVYEETSAPVNAMGMWGMAFGEWVSDSWHETYTHASFDSVSWAPGAEVTIARGGSATMWPWEDGLQFVLSHTAIRHQARNPLTVWGLRFARDLP